MIDLTKKSLPDTVSVCGEDFPVYTDFRIWLRFCIEFEKWDKDGTLDISYLFRGVQPTFYCLEDYSSIFAFAFPKNICPHGDSGGEKILDFEVDSDYIYDAFLQQYGIDLLDIEHLHWFKFKALLNGIGKPTRLYEIMGYRSYNGKDKDMQSIKSVWELPVEETAEEKVIRDKFDDFFEPEP